MVKLTESEEPACKNCRYCKTRTNADGGMFQICAYDTPKVTHTLIPAGPPDMRGAIPMVWRTCSSWPEVQLDNWCRHHERELNS